MITNETVENILNRRSVRSYTDEAVTDEQLETILRCGCYAPSARNLQGCVAVAVKDKDFLDKMNRQFKEFVGVNTPAYTNWDKSPFYQNASAVIFIFSKKEKENYFTEIDSGIMVENMTVAAKSIGLGSCILGCVCKFLTDEKGSALCRELGFDDDYTFRIALAVGNANEEPPAKPRNENEFFILK